MFPAGEGFQIFQQLGIQHCICHYGKPHGFYRFAILARIHDEWVAGRECVFGIIHAERIDPVQGVLAVIEVEAPM